MLYEDHLSDRLEAWAKVSVSRLSQLLDTDAAWTLVDSLFSESIGRIIDEHLDSSREVRSPDPALARPSYSELKDFFQRFSPEVALSLSRRLSESTVSELESLRQLQNATCERIVRDLPSTLGAYGRAVFAREWRSVLEELPYRAEALLRAARTPGGEKILETCQTDLNAILDSTRNTFGTAGDLLRLRTDARDRLRRAREVAKQERKR